MLKKARIISFTVALAAALGIVPGVSAEEKELLIEPNYTSYVITLSGSVGTEYAGGLVNIEILKPVGEGITVLPAVTPENISSTVVLFSSTTVKDDGSFEYKFKLNESARAENPFWARVNIDAVSETNCDVFLTNSFAYTSKTEIDTKLESYKSFVNYENLEEDALLMGITLPAVWNSFDESQKSYSASVILEKIQADNSELSTDTLEAHITDGIMISSARNANNTEQLMQFLTEEEQTHYFGLDFTNTYYIQHTEKLKVFERMKDLITSESEKADIARIFREILLLESVQTASYKNNIQGIITEFKDVISHDNFNAYGRLNPTQLDSVNSAVISATDEQLSTIANFNSMLDKAIDKAKNAASKPSGKGSGGSGGGGKGVVMVGKPVQTENKETLTPAEKDEVSEPVVFSDISGYEWAEKAISELHKKGIINGKEDGKFCPGDKITREEVVKIICSAFGFEANNNATVFNDVKGKWFEGYVNTAYEKNIISGIDAETFGAGIAITREDFIVILARTVKEDNEGELTFKDSALISDYARNAIYSLNRKGVISGYPDGTFNPKGNMTRAEAAVAIYNLLDIYA